MDKPILVPSEDHSYRNVKLFKTKAVFNHTTQEWSEYAGEDYLLEGDTLHDVYGMSKPKKVTKAIIDVYERVEDVEIKYNTNGGISHTTTEVMGVGKVKPCGHCKSVKPVNDFHKDKKSPVGLSTRCKDCACKRPRQLHSDRMKDPMWLDDRRSATRQFNRGRKKAAVVYKGDVCNDCGITYPDYVYDFHHLNGDTKTDNPSAILRRTWEKAKEELDLCVLLCANCHRERHYGQT